MLVLKRYKDGRIMVGDDVVITLVEVGPGWAKIGIDAPKEKAIDREEVRRSKKRGPLMAAAKK